MWLNSERACIGPHRTTDRPPYPRRVAVGAVREAPRMSWRQRVMTSATADRIAASWVRWAWINSKRRAKGNSRLAVTPWDRRGRWPQSAKKPGQSVDCKDFKDTVVQCPKRAKGRPCKTPAHSAKRSAATSARC